MVSGMMTSDVSGGVGGPVDAGTGTQAQAPPVEMAVAPTAVILLLIGEQNKASASDSRRGGSLDVLL